MGNTLRSVLIGKIDEWPEKLGKSVNIGKIQLAVFKLESGEIRAIENRCPHKGGVLAEGIVTGEYVFCPMHDWKINVLDGKVQEPDIGCVKTFPVEVKENQVYVLLDR